MDAPRRPAGGAQDDPRIFSGRAASGRQLTETRGPYRAAARSRALGLAVLLLLTTPGAFAGSPFQPALPQSSLPGIAAFAGTAGPRPAAGIGDTLPGILAGAPADSSEAPSDSSGPVHSTRLTIVAGAMAAAMVGIHLYQESGWWRYNRAPFHFREDLTYGLSVDKIGHFYGTSLWAFSLRKILGWANVPERQALLLGSGGAFLFQTFVEVEDGLSTWGFDRIDFLCDLGGALWPIAQYHSSALRDINIKLSYTPSSLLNKPSGGGFAGQKHLIMDDYEGQTFWLSIPPGKILPAGAASLWPGFLRIAVGYGVRDVAGVSGPPYSVVFIGFDYDMKKIIPQTSPFLVTLSEVLDFIRFPAPAIRLAPTTILYGLYY